MGLGIRRVVQGEGGRWPCAVRQLLAPHCLKDRAGLSVAGLRPASLGLSCSQAAGYFMTQESQPQ
jgi:hypothetical protein